MIEDNSLTLLWDVLPRILSATLCGALIGLERDIHGRAAGLRTHTLVSAGAALFTIVSILMASEDGLSLKLSRSDPGRIAAQIVSGIGFLGAGTIVKAGLSVKGLTTAACLWFVAALGMTCGLNQCPAAVAVALLGLAIIFTGKRLERKLQRTLPFQLVIEATSIKAIEEVRTHLEQDRNTIINSFDITHNCSSKVTRAVLSLETKSGRQHMTACLETTEHLMQHYPEISLIAYKTEGQP